MRFKSIQINGLRGFSTFQQLDFALPNGKPGSGLTVLVGPNNGGKSTIVEALQVLTAEGNKSFSEGKRNKLAGDSIYLRATTENGGSIELQSHKSGAPGVQQTSEGGPWSDVLILPSRRYFNAYFEKSTAERNVYINNLEQSLFRGGSINHFTARLFRAQNNRKEFDEILGRVLFPVPKWNQ